MYFSIFTFVRKWWFFPKLVTHTYTYNVYINVLQHGSEGFD